MSGIERRQEDPAFYFNLLIFLVKNLVILKDPTLSMSLQHTITPPLSPLCLLTPARSPQECTLTLYLHSSPVASCLCSVLP